MAKKEKCEASSVSVRDSLPSDVEDFGGVCTDTDVADTKSIASNKKTAFHQTDLSSLPDDFH